ncbi:MAG TPA: transposase [Terriglobia bacterium]|nr:transposase [Terriglobia bacterium]
MKRTRDGRRRFSREVKLNAVKRLQEGERLSKVAKEMKVEPALLARWNQQFRTGGEQALKEVGRPRGRGLRPPAGRRTAELERLVGRQQAAIDFLERALRRVEELRQNKRDDGGTASSR